MTIFYYLLNICHPKELTVNLLQMNGFVAPVFTWLYVGIRGIKSGLVLRDSDREIAASGGGKTSESSPFTAGCWSVALSAARVVER